MSPACGCTLGRRFPQDEAVEAEAIAQLLDEDAKEPTVDSVRVTYNVTDQEKLGELLRNSPRIVRRDMSDEQLQSMEGPKPTGLFFLLDREVPSDIEAMTHDQVPSMIGFLTLYDRQTDRSERMELVVDRNDEFDETVAAVKEIVGDAIETPGDEQVLGPSPRGDSTLSWRWYFPPETPSEKRQQLLTDERRTAFLERWPDEAKAVLGGATPREAKDNLELKLPLMATVLILEQGATNDDQSETLAQLRSDLGLPEVEPIAADSVDASNVPMVRVPRIKLEGMSDEDLSLLYKRSVLTNAEAALRAIATEGLKRPEFANEVPFDTLYEQLFVATENEQEAVGVLDEARGWAKSHDKSCAPWDLLELELHISSNNPDGANRLLKHLRDEHMDEPEVAQQVYQLLYMIGAIPEEAVGAVQAGVPVGQAVESPSDSTIWTPGGEGQQGGGESKLWTPD